MATQVSVVTAATGAVDFYSTYAAARSAGDYDLIQIWADLTDEQILLKDKVDIWVAPGRIIKTSNAETLIVDNDGSYTSAVQVNITGNGIFINEGDKYRCAAISNSGSKVSIECESLEGTGNDPQYDEWATVHIVNASKFYLKCNRIYNKTQKAIYFDNEVDDVNINANIIENGIYDGGDLITIRGSGFLNANQAISNNGGSCLAHKAGNLISNISKLITTESPIRSGNSAVLDLSGGTGTQNLTLYFDVIENADSQGGNAVNAAEGIINLIGRRISSASGLSLDLAGDADILLNEIISAGRCIDIHNGTTKKVVIDANNIEGATGSSDGIVYCNADANFVLRNAKIKNLTTSGTTPFSFGIYLGDTGTIKMELENIIVVTGDLSMNGVSIFSVTNRDVKNLGLFVNKPISGSITLLIGTEAVTGNYKYIVSDDIT